MAIRNIQTVKISAIDRAVTRPSRYGAIGLVAVLVAESAHAPLLSRAVADSPNAGAVIALEAKPKTAAVPPRGVKDPKEYKPLAFDDKNRREFRKLELGRDLIPDKPLVLDPHGVPVTDPLIPTGLTNPPEITDGIVTPAGHAGGYVDPLPSETPVFAAADPSSGFDLPRAAPVRPVVSVHGPVTSIPEPGSAVALLTGCLFRRRSIRGRGCTPAAPTPQS